MLGFVIVGGLFVALMLGSLVARNDFIKIGGMVAIVVGAAVCLGLGKKIWLVIPASWLLVGKIGILPLPFSVRDLGVFAAFTTFVGLMVFKKLPVMARPRKVDFLLFLNIAYLVTVYLRNPVGTLALGSEMIGGRPYVDVIVALLAYWVLQHVMLTKKEAVVMPFLISLGAGVVATLGVLTMKFPSLVPIIAPFYSGIDVSTYMRQQNTNAVDPNVERATPLLGFGTTVGTALVSYVRPMEMILFLRPVRSILYYVSFVFILFSGYRSALISLGIFSLLSSYFFGGVKEVVRMLFALAIGIISIIVLQTSGLVEMPLSVQRALSFIPAGWDERAVSDAKTSSDWRFDMWQIALESDKYIKNKVLGDGFGYSLYELKIQMAAAWGGTGYLDGNDAEAQLVSGAYHSGPISAIRYVGAVGLILFTIFLVATAFYGWQVIVATRNTPFFPLALFGGLAAIYKPFEYWFVFGQFDSDLPKAIFTLAILNMAMRSQSNYSPNNLKPNIAAQQRSAEQPST